MNRRHAEILALIEVLGPMSDPELAGAHASMAPDLPPNPGIGAARRRLVAAGVLREAGTWTVTESGRRVAVWEVAR